MSEKQSDGLPKNFKASKCILTQDGNLVCEGTIDGKPTVCEVKPNTNKLQVNCKAIGENQPV